jgi:hypothetical protein
MLTHGHLLRYECTPTGNHLSTQGADDMQNDVDDTDEANEQLVASGQRGVKNTPANGRLNTGGMKQVHCLDAIMHNKYAGNHYETRAWETAIPIQRAPQRGKKQASSGSKNPPAANPADAWLSKE